MRPRLFPWLILCCLTHQTTSTYSIHDFDPYSRTWLSVIRRDKFTGNKSVLPPNFLHGSSRDLLYTLSPYHLVISKDPFGISSQMEAKGPDIWRHNPVVAAIGRWIVVVGGGFMADFDEDEEEGEVEVYNKETGSWELAEPMPAKFEGLAYATWFSVTVSNKRLYMIEKKTGWSSWFDPESKIWGPTCQLIPDPTVSNWAIGIAGNERLLLAGAGSKGGVMMVRTWEVDGDTLQPISRSKEEIPAEMVDHFYPNFDSLDDYRQQACSVEIRGTECGGYMFDPANMKNGMVLYQLSMELEEEGRSVGKWEWVPFPAAVIGCNLISKISVGCSPVSLHEVARYFV